MADYDAGDITDRERLAAERQKTIGEFNAQAVRNQLARQIDNYNMADQQNAALRDVQLKQASRRAEADRFEAQRALRNAALGLFGSMNQGFNSSTIGNTLSMLRDRNDADNSTYWQQLTNDRNQVLNAYDESVNQNRASINDAVTNATKALQDLEADTSANLANINPNLFLYPGDAGYNYHSETLYNNNKVNPHLATLSGYIMPQNAEQNVQGNRNQVKRNDYFGNMLNRFNGR